MWGMTLFDKIFFFFFTLKEQQWETRHSLQRYKILQTLSVSLYNEGHAGHIPDFYDIHTQIHAGHGGKKLAEKSLNKNNEDAKNFPI